MRNKQFYILSIIIFTFCSCSNKIYKNNNQFNFGNEYFEYARGHFPIDSPHIIINPIDTSWSQVFVDSTISSIEIKRLAIMNKFTNNNLGLHLNKSQKIAVKQMMQSQAASLKKYQRSVYYFILSAVSFVLVTVLISSFINAGATSLVFPGILYALSIIFAMLSITVSLSALTHQIIASTIFYKLLSDLCIRGQTADIEALLNYMNLFISRNNMFNRLSKNKMFSQLILAPENVSVSNYFFRYYFSNSKGNFNVFRFRKFFGNPLILIIMYVLLILLFLPILNNI